MAIEDDDDRAAFLDPGEFGSVVVYTPKDGAAGPEIAGLLMQSGVLVEFGGGSPAHDARRSRLAVKASDLPGGSPDDGDGVTVDGVNYTVVPPFPADSGLVWLTLEVVDA